jgi:hypothetical protein
VRALLNIMAATARQSEAGESGTREASVTAYDPDNYAVKVQLQPTGEETGWTSNRVRAIRLVAPRCIRSGRQ